MVAASGFFFRVRTRAPANAPARSHPHARVRTTRHFYSTMAAVISCSALAARVVSGSATGSRARGAVNLRAVKMTNAKGRGALVVSAVRSARDLRARARRFPPRRARRFLRGVHTTSRDDASRC
eukprot:30017-Pelagococcus_subviridis.AAC.24